MPGMNGWDFFAELRRRPAYAKVPVIIHSSAVNRAPAGVTRVLQKPLELQNLLATVKEFCGP
jgi:CheY-like chemotaxis protein